MLRDCTYSFFPKKDFWSRNSPICHPNPSPGKRASLDVRVSECTPGECNEDDLGQLGGPRCGQSQGWEG